MSDRRLIYAAAFLRAVATGMTGVLIGLHLARRGLDAAEVGLVVGAGLGGAAAAALAVMLLGDRLGRRRVLVAVTVLGAAGCLGVAFATTMHALLAAAFLGMVNGMGRDRGAALVIDHAILPGTTTAVRRTSAFAWYTLLQDVGHALGALAGGAPALLQRFARIDEPASTRTAMVGCAALLLAAAAIYTRLSRAAEATSRVSLQAPPPGSRSVLWRISALFALDSVAGGFLTAALLSYYFFVRFGVSEGELGLLFFAARVANAASHLAAAWLARRIGLVNTMVFTHVPSSLLLVTVAWAPTFPVAAALFLLREGLVEMDVPTRQSYVMALVRPQDRTFASGLTSLVRLAGWASAPAFAGRLMAGSSLAVPLYVGAALKLTYDALLYAGFRGIRPEEERGRERAA
jgi:MFS family permease